MTATIMKSDVTSSFAQSEEDVMLCQGLRHKSFRDSIGFDLDKYDDVKADSKWINMELISKF